MAKGDNDQRLFSGVENFMTLRINYV